MCADSGLNPGHFYSRSHAQPTKLPIRLMLWFHGTLILILFLTLTLILLNALATGRLVTEHFLVSAEVATEVRYNALARSTHNLASGKAVKGQFSSKLSPIEKIEKMRVI